jgi:hypothetical protein
MSRFTISVSTRDGLQAFERATAVAALGKAAELREIFPDRLVRIVDEQGCEVPERARTIELLVAAGPDTTSRVNRFSGGPIKAVVAPSRGARSRRR